MSPVALCLSRVALVDCMRVEAISSYLFRHLCWPFPARSPTQHMRTLYPQEASQSYPSPKSNPNLIPLQSWSQLWLSSRLLNKLANCRDKAFLLGTLHSRFRLFHHHRHLMHPYFALLSSKVATGMLWAMVLGVGLVQRKPPWRLQSAAAQYQRLLQNFGSLLRRLEVEGERR